MWGIPSRDVVKSVIAALWFITVLACVFAGGILAAMSDGVQAWLVAQWPLGLVAWLCGSVLTLITWACGFNNALNEGRDLLISAVFTIVSAAGFAHLLLAAVVKLF